MANFEGVIATGRLISDQTGDVYEFTGSRGGAGGWLIEPTDDQEILGDWTFVPNKLDRAANPVNYEGVDDQDNNATSEWFEAFHVIPRSFDFGNLLSAQSANIEVFSAFRDDVESWTAFINNAGTGIELSGAPTLPNAYQPFTGSQMTLDVGTDGPPNVNSTLDFVFGTVPQTTSVPIELQRILLLNLPPEKGYTETLAFLTDVIPHVNGSEQRISLRKNPRQIFEWTIKALTGTEAQLWEHILYDWQQRTFGLPMWHELTTLTVEATAAVTQTITVGTTDFSDYRVGGLVLIYQDQTTFDVAEIQSFTSTTITFTNPVLVTHPVGTQVMPLRVAIASNAVRVARSRVGQVEYRMRFQVTNNDNDIRSTAAFSSYNGKVLLDGLNVVRGVLSENLVQNAVLFDNEVGVPVKTSEWDRHKRDYTYTFFVKTRQALWELRQLLHALGGRWKSFYVPTFKEDLTIIDDITAAQNTLTIANVGYTLYVRQRQPKGIIQIFFTDGTSLIRTITGSVVVDATEETLTMGDTWPDDRTIDEVVRISYLEELRFDDDQIRIVHERTPNGPAIVQAPVRTVFD